jgi:hypothetical protein
MNEAMRPNLPSFGASAPPGTSHGRALERQSARDALAGATTFGTTSWL